MLFQKVFNYKERGCKNFYSWNCFGYAYCIQKIKNNFLALAQNNAKFVLICNFILL